MNNSLSTEKKQWITPKVEIISRDVVQAGSTPAAAEGVTIAPGPPFFITYFGSAS